MLTIRRGVALATTTLLLGCMAVAGAGDHTPFHDDPKAVRQAVLDTVGALIDEDAVRARKGMDTIHGGIRLLKVEEEDVFGRLMIGYSQAYLKGLNLAREHAGAGELDEAFKVFVWLQRDCRTCHRRAREEGLLPELGQPVSGVPEVPADGAGRDLGDHR